MFVEHVDESFERHLVFIMFEPSREPMSVIGILDDGAERDRIRSKSKMETCFFGNQIVK